ncbi:nuclear transport factor 2 family protein [Comamonadaceae bacterium PP-2]
MPQTRMRAVALSSSPDEIETTFYEALRDADVERVMACWADEDEIVCVHPGVPRMVGSGAIRRGYEQLLSHGALRIHTEQVRRVETMTCAVHSLIERVEVVDADGVDEVYVVATNVYHRTAQGWRLVAHHAGPASGAELHEVNDNPSVLH